MGVTANGDRASFRTMTMFWNYRVLMVAQLWIDKKTTELHTLNGRIYCYVNYISIFSKVSRITTFSFSTLSNRFISHRKSQKNTRLGRARLPIASLISPLLVFLSVSSLHAHASWSSALPHLFCVSTPLCTEPLFMDMWLLLPTPQGISPRCGGDAKRGTTPGMAILRNAHCTLFPNVKLDLKEESMMKTQKS